MSFSNTNASDNFPGAGHGISENPLSYCSENFAFDPLQQGWILELDMIQEEPSEGMVCIVAWLWGYTGGAHGNTSTQAFIFDLNTGETIEVIAYLNEMLMDEGWIEKGASADPVNYHTVLPVPDENGNISGYTVLFLLYQVDCYASGVIEVFVPSPEIQMKQ